MIQMYKWLRSQLSIVHWALIHAFLVFGLGWGVAIALYPPLTFDGVVDIALVFRMGVSTAIGSIVACVGLLMTRSLYAQRQHKGLWIELVGTILLGGGALQYFSIQLGYLFSGEFAMRYALVWFTYTLGAFISVRFAILIPALINSSRQARNQERSPR